MQKARDKRAALDGIMRRDEGARSLHPCKYPTHAPTSASAGRSGMELAPGKEDICLCWGEFLRWAVENWPAALQTKPPSFQSKQHCSKHQYMGLWGSQPPRSMRGTWQRDYSP